MTDETRELLQDAAKLSSEYLALAYQRGTSPGQANILWTAVHKRAGQLSSSPMSRQVFSENNLAGAAAEMEFLHRDKGDQYVTRWSNPSEERIGKDAPPQQKKEEELIADNNGPMI